VCTSQASTVKVKCVAHLHEVEGLLVLGDRRHDEQREGVLNGALLESGIGKELLGRTPAPATVKVKCVVVSTVKVECAVAGTVEVECALAGTVQAKCVAPCVATQELTGAG